PLCRCTSLLFRFLYCFACPRDLHSFPTRRSSDLPTPIRPAACPAGSACRWPSRSSPVTKAISGTRTARAAAPASSLSCRLLPSPTRPDPARLRVRRFLGFALFLVVPGGQVEQSRAGHRRGGDGGIAAHEPRRDPATGLQRGKRGAGFHPLELLELRGARRERGQQVVHGRVPCRFGASVGGAAFAARVRAAARAATVQVPRGLARCVAVADHGSSGHGCLG